MRKNGTIILCALMLVLSLVFVACETTTISGIEITASPKLTYYEGETFDQTGLEVSRILSDGTVEVIEDYTVEAPDKITRTDNKVTVRYGKHSCRLELTVIPTAVTDVEFKFDESLQEGGNVSLDAVLYRPTYNDGTFDEEWIALTAEDVISQTVEDGVLKVELEIFAKNAIIKKNLTFDISEKAVTVSELLDKTEPYSYLLKGRLVGFGYTNVTEYLVAEEETGAIIGVAGLEGEGTFADLDLDLKGFEIGDEVLVPVTLKTAAIAEGSANSGKVYAQYAVDSIMKAQKIGHSDGYTLNKESAVDISTQEQLREFLSAENRPENAYKLVRLNGKINFITYNKFVRFFFDGVTNYTDQKIDGVNCSPVFYNPTQYYTTGNTFGELMFDDPNFTSTAWANPKYVQKEVYAVFIGGTTWYHYFIILSENDISSGEIVKVDFTAPEADAVSLGGELDLTGGAFWVTYEFGQVTEIPLTAEMLDQSTLPDTDQPGNYTVTAKYGDNSFTFDVEVLAKSISEVKLETDLSKAEYSYYFGRDELTEELTGKNIVVSYDNNTSDVVAITADMLKFESWSTTEGSVVINYMENICTVAIKVTVQSISVAEFKTKTSGRWAVRMQVVDSVSSQGAIELIVKDVDTNDFLGVYNSGVAGSTSSPKLDTTFVNKGDIIVDLLTVTVGTSNANVGKLYGNGVNGDTFKANLVVESTGNTLDLDPTKMTVAAEISSQQDLETFLNTENRFYKVVKISADVKGVKYNSFLRIFFGDSVVDFASQKVNGISPVFNDIGFTNRAKSLSEVFTNATSTSYSAPATTTYTFYVLFVGGNAYYHVFAPLAESWLVAPQA